MSSSFAPSVGARRRLVVVIIATVLCLGCSDAARATRAPSDVLEWKLSDGRSVASVSGFSGLRVVLILEPSDCLSCYRGLAVWRAWAESDSGQLAILLTQRPDSLGRVALALAGIRPTGILAEQPGLRTPIQVVLRDSRPPHIVVQANDDVALALVTELRREQAALSARPSTVQPRSSNDRELP